MDAGNLNMTHEELKDQLHHILIEHFGIEAAQIHKDATLYEDLGMDSIDAVDIMQRITELTELRLAPEEFHNISTVGDFTDILQSLQAE